MTGDFNLINTPTKSKWAAHLLNLIFPGVGLIYWRRGTAGLYWLGLSLGVSVGFISIWMLYPFLPQLLASYLALYWGLAQWVLYEKVNARAATQSIWSRNVSLPPFFGLSILCLSLISLVIYIGMTRVYTFVHVRDMSMYPQLLDGDILLVDRRVQAHQEFNVGEVVVYNSNSTGITVSRVISAPKRHARVEVVGAQVKIMDQPYYQEAVTIDVEHLHGGDVRELDQSLGYLRHYVEYPPVNEQLDDENYWLVSEPLDPSRGQLSLTGHLGKNTLLVLPDMRTPPTNQLAHHGEIIDRSRVIGRPLIVISSSFPHPYSSSRQGLKID